MEPLSSLAIVSLAGLIHASFQLSVSMLTLLSGHTIGGRASHVKVLRRAGSFILGVVLMTLLLLSSTILVLQVIFGTYTPPLLWSVGCGLLMGLGIAVWVFYYRKASGTTLWLPRNFATFLARRTKATNSSAEAFSLGMASVIAEIIFILPLLLISAMTLLQLTPVWQATGIALYVGFASLSLGIIGVLVGSGHKLSRIQKWREANKRFLQFAAGSGLLVLGFYIYVDYVLTAALVGLGT